MIISPELIPAVLQKRYKRFLGDVCLPSGEMLTVHTPNTGAMTGCAMPGMRVWLRDTQNPKRKYRYSWEVSETDSGVMVGVNTGIVNQLVSEAIENGIVSELQGYDTVQQEVRYGQENSRIDLLLSRHGRSDCYTEIKNVTAVDDKGNAFFPDAPSVRGTKHLRELMEMTRQGYRSVLLFCVQRCDVNGVRPADEVDPVYGETLRTAVAAGVEVLAYAARVSPGEILLTHSVPVVID